MLGVAHYYNLSSWEAEDYPESEASLSYPAGLAQKRRKENTAYVNKITKYV